MDILIIALIFNVLSTACTEEIAEESGSGMYGDYQSVSASGMLGDEIMPISAIDNFDQPVETDSNENEADDLEKRGKINKADDGGTKKPAKRVWNNNNNNMYPYYHWLHAQQQQQQQHSVQFTLPAGKCLEENSLCDIGHDEQCCGHATYCVDYWGVGKCLAFIRPDKYDSLPVRINRNNLYKAYYKRLQFAATRNG